MHTKQILLQLKEKVDYLKNYLIVGHQKCLLCTEGEHFPDGTSEIFILHRNRTLSRRYFRNVYCVQKQKTFQTQYQNYVLWTETEHFSDGTLKVCTVHTNRTYSDGTHKAVLTDYKTTYKKEAQRFTVIHTYQHIQLKHNKSYT